MKILTVILAVLLIVGLNLSAFAQDDEARDILEISIYGGAAIPSGGISNWAGGNEDPPVELGAKTGWQAGLDFGVFLSESIVLGANFSYAQFSIDSDDARLTHNHKLYNPSLYLKYLFFGETNTVPYVKGSVGLSIPKFSTPVRDSDGSNLRNRELSYSPGISFGAAAGVFRYTSDYSGIFLQAGYMMAMTEDSDKTKGSTTYVFGESTGIIDLRAGIVLFFGSDE